ncbi:hypothetical protein ACNFJN_13100 [Xenorhabdus budapestensis]|uniref:hypothetical protein n=1 Tax=Xenorhabdus budapestensis TaxID=290110 RepID=UPI003A89B19F
MALFLFVKEENHNTGLFVVNMYFKRFFQLFSAFSGYFWENIQNFTEIKLTNKDKWKT